MRQSLVSSIINGGERNASFIFNNYNNNNMTRMIE